MKEEEVQKSRMKTRWEERRGRGEGKSGKIR